MRRISVLLIVLSLMLPAAAAAGASGPNDHAAWGLCQAWKATEEARAQGGPADSWAFLSVQQDAEEDNTTVEDHCADVPAPSEAAGAAGQGQGQAQADARGQGDAGADNAPDRDANTQGHDGDRARPDNATGYDGNDTDANETDEAEGNETAADRGRDNRTHPDAGPSEHARFGLCTAWMHNQDGRENGTVADSWAFLSVQEQAEEENSTVSDYCEDVPHPGDAHRNGNASHADDARSQGQAEDRRPSHGDAEQDEADDADGSQGSSGDTSSRSGQRGP